MAYGLLIGDDVAVASWAFTSYGRYPAPVNRALGIVGPDKVLKGAILFQNFNGTNIEMSYYGEWTVSLGIVRVMARVVVTEFNAARLTVVTTKKNRRLMRSLQKFGFKLEGVQRRYYGHRDCSRNTGVRFVLFREEIDKLARIQNLVLEHNKG